MPYQNGFARIFKKDTFDYQNEFQKLKQWVNILKNSALYDAPNHGAQHMDMIIRICAAIQYQAKQRISFWDKFLHFFTAQSSIEVLNETTQKCNEALAVYQQKLGGSEGSLQELCDERQKKMALQEKLKQFMEICHHVPWTCCGLFKPPFTGPQLYNAASALHRVLEDDISLDILQQHSVVLDGKELHALYKEFNLFYHIEPLITESLLV